MDHIITKSISRFSRNTVTLLETVRELKELGISVYFEEQSIDTATADGELMLSILASYLPAILKRFTFAQKCACHKFIHVIRLPLEEWYLC